MTRGPTKPELESLTGSTAELYIQVRQGGSLDVGPTCFGTVHLYVKFCRGATEIPCWDRPLKQRLEWLFSRSLYKLVATSHQVHPRSAFIHVTKTAGISRIEVEAFRGRTQSCSQYHWNSSLVPRQRWAWWQQITKQIQLHLGWCMLEVCGYLSWSALGVFLCSLGSQTARNSLSFGLPVSFTKIAPLEPCSLRHPLWAWAWQNDSFSEASGRLRGPSRLQSTTSLSWMQELHSMEET